MTMSIVEPLTASWYYQRWPGFYNEKCYSIFEDFSNNPEKYRSQDTVDEGVEEYKESDPVSLHEPNKNLKRKLCECDCHKLV